MQVKLFSKTPNYLKTAWVAARTCYSADSPFELLEEEKTDEEMLKLIDHIMKNKHLSVLEHCHMTFAVKDVSRALLAQYTRHRIGVSMSVQSQRYVSEHSSKSKKGLFDHVIPETITRNKEALYVYSDAMNNIQQAYDTLIDFGVAKQDARFVLPNGACTNFVTSFNLRSFMDMYDKRVTIPGAQWEIRELMNALRDELVKQEPWLDKYIPKKEKN